MNRHWITKGIIILTMYLGCCRIEDWHQKHLLERESFVLNWANMKIVVYEMNNCKLFCRWSMNHYYYKSIFFLHIYSGWQYHNFCYTSLNSLCFNSNNIYICKMIFIVPTNALANARLVIKNFISNGIV